MLRYEEIKRDLNLKVIPIGIDLDVLGKIQGASPFYQIVIFLARKNHPSLLDQTWNALDLWELLEPYEEEAEKLLWEEEIKIQLPEYINHSEKYLSFRNYNDDWYCYHRDCQKAFLGPSLANVIFHLSEVHGPEVVR